MSDKFLSLDGEKQKIIRNSAIEEFALQGYDKASTDVIAAKSGISKGSLFNYFTNKLNLYVYVLEYAMNTINHAIYDQVVQIEDSDFYDRLKKISLIKHKVIKEYPKEARIINTFFVTPPKHTDSLAGKIKDYYDFNNKLLQEHLFKYLDDNKLREGVTKEEALFITTTLIEALIRRYAETNSISLKHQHSYIDEKAFDFDKYIEILKHGVYKE